MTDANANAKTVTEYMLAERVAGELTLLPHCGSWYTDRYYTGDKMGLDAAYAALDRVASVTEGDFTVVHVRDFRRGETRKVRTAPREVPRPLTDRPNIRQRAAAAHPALRAVGYLLACAGGSAVLALAYTVGARLVSALTRLF